MITAVTWHLVNTFCSLSASEHHPNLPQIKNTTHLYLRGKRNRGKSYHEIKMYAVTIIALKNAGMLPKYCVEKNNK